MGEPILIDKVAKRMIHLAGYQVANSEEEINTANSIFIEYTGLRDGEKLFEELLIGEDVSGTDHPKVMRANENFFEWEVIEAIILETRDAIMKNDQKKLMAIIKKTVTDYNYEKIN